MRLVAMLPILCAVMVGSVQAQGAHGSVSAAGTPSINMLLHQSPQFSTMSRLVDASGLAIMFNGRGPFLLFAPTDAAFARQSPALVNDLLLPENKSKLMAFVVSHVLPGAVDVRSPRQTALGMTLGGTHVSFDPADGGRVNGAPLSGSAILVANGVVQPIDAVIGRP